MLRNTNVCSDRRLVLTFGILCLAAMLVMTGCNSKTTTSTTTKPTPTPTTRTAAALPAGFVVYKSEGFHLAHPTSWQQQNPPNGTGVQYTGPAQQQFVAASLGKIQNSPEAFNAAYCSPTGEGGTPEGAAKVVNFGGESWRQQECVDAKTGKTAVIESTVHNQDFYYLVYGSPAASFQTNRTQYFTPMEQSFTFI